MRRILLLALFLGAAEPLAGQTPVSLALGKRVKVQTLSETGRYNVGVDGTLEFLSPDSLIIKTRPWGDLLTVQTNKDTRYFVHMGRKAIPLRGALIGMTAGVITAAAIWAIKGKQCPDEKFTCNSREQLFMEGSAIFAAAGATIGFGLGTILLYNIWASAPGAGADPRPMLPGVGIRIRF
jgi:hypothetical protein